MRTDGQPLPSGPTHDRRRRENTRRVARVASAVPVKISWISKLEIPLNGYRKDCSPAINSVSFQIYFEAAYEPPLEFQTEHEEKPFRKGKMP